MTRVLVVGGLTVDRFSDGRQEPGGSVLHSSAALAAEGATVTFVTVSGSEPAALDGLQRLRGVGVVARQPAAASTTYRHIETAEGRVLVYEAASDPIQPSSLPEAGDPLWACDVALLAPIANELPPTVVHRIREAVRPALTVLLIQGWLRDLRVGEPVRPLALDGVSRELLAQIGHADAVVVSTEDLVESRGDPFAQAGGLRAHLGPRPILVVTLGVNGYLVDDPGADAVVASVPRRVVSGVPTVGAGDIFGAVLGVRLARGEAASAAAAAAADLVIAMLDARGAAMPSG